MCNEGGKGIENKAQIYSLRLLPEIENREASERMIMSLKCQWDI